MAIKSDLFQLGVITISFCDQIGQLLRHAVTVRLNFKGALVHYKNSKAIFTENIDKRWTLTNSLNSSFSIGIILNHKLEWTRIFILDGRTKRMITTKSKCYYLKIHPSNALFRMFLLKNVTKWIVFISSCLWLCSVKYLKMNAMNVAGITSLVTVSSSKWILSSAFTFILGLDFASTRSHHFNKMNHCH